MPPRNVRLLEDLHVPKHLRQFIPEDPEKEAAWNPGPDVLSFEEFIRQAGEESTADADGTSAEDEAGSKPQIIELPPAPPEPTFHHVRAGPETGQPWLYPDVTNLVCTGMSITDVEVLTRQRAEKKRLKNLQIREREVKGHVFVIDTYSWDDGHQKDFTRDDVTVYVPLRRDLLPATGVSADMVDVQFGPHSFHLTVSLPNNCCMKLGYDKLAHEIVPEKSRFQLSTRSQRVTIRLRKKVVSNSDSAARWAGLGAGHYSVPCNSNSQIMKRRVQSQNPEANHELIDISHLRHWTGPPKVEWDSN